MIRKPENKVNVQKIAKQGDMRQVLTLYFSGTGNTEYIAKLFSKHMCAECLSIEDDADFVTVINNHDIIVFCYPIYASRVPRNMREFVEKHMNEISGKKIVILVTQVLFSGDGARVFTDMFQENTVEVIYAEHIKMPNNVGTIPFLRPPSEKLLQKTFNNAEALVERICKDIKCGIVRKRGFSWFSKVLGSIQGQVWYGNSKKIAPRSFSGEAKSRNGVRIHKDCNACGVCVTICPMKNFADEHGRIIPKGTCIVCYRCVNRCPTRAITVMTIRLRPKWQYTCARQGDGSSVFR